MNEGPFMSCWSLLPPDILVHIIELLGDPDRYSLSLTCKRWNEVSKSGCLWRKRSYIFRGYCQNKEARIRGIRQCVQCVGHHIKHLQLVCHSPNLITASNIAACVRVLCMELCSLPRGRTTLDSLSIKDLYFDETWRGFRTSRNRLIFSLTNFIQYQKKLRTIDVSNAFLPAPYAFFFLEAVMTRKPTEFLHNVNIENFFSPMISSARLHLAMHLFVGALVHIRRISLNLSYLQDKSLLLLCSRNTNILQQLDLHISWKSNGEQLDPITPDAWKKALLHCPHLKVTVSMDHWPRNPTAFVNPELPLVEFHLKGFLCGVCKMSYVSKFLDMLHYLSGHYSVSLNKISFLLKFGKNPKCPPIQKEKVMAFLRQCPKLKLANLSHALISFCNEDGMQVRSVFPKETSKVDQTRGFTVRDFVDSRGFGYSSFLINTNGRQS